MFRGHITVKEVMSIVPKLKKHSHTAAGRWQGLRLPLVPPVPPLGFLDARLAAIAALGTVFTGLSSFTAMREAVFQDRRNAERYKRTSLVLEDLYKKINEVRKAVFTAGLKPLRDYIEVVHEQLSLEHRQWLGELSEARGTFARLENTLKDLSTTDSKNQDIN